MPRDRHLASGVDVGYDAQGPVSELADPVLDSRVEEAHHVVRDAVHVLRFVLVGEDVQSVVDLPKETTNVQVKIINITHFARYNSERNPLFLLYPEADFKRYNESFHQRCYNCIEIV